MSIPTLFSRLQTLSIILVLISIVVIMAIVLSPYELSFQAFYRKQESQIDRIFPGIGESHLLDGLHNILLFFPLGFFFSLYCFSKRWPFPDILAWTGTLALVVSYWAEFLQLFIPGRFSSVIDVFSNILGGLLGFFSALLINQEAKKH